MAVLSRAWHRLAVAGFGFLLVLSAATPAVAQTVPLRQVNWNDVLTAAGPVVRASSDCIPLPSSAPDQLGPCVHVTVNPPQAVHGVPEAQTGEFTGYALTGPDQIDYGDLDADGRQEAVVRVDSTGTGGSFGFLVYSEGTPAPRLIAAVPGYKVSARILGSLLEVRMPYYFGSEGNCCPTGTTRTMYRLEGDALRIVSRTYLTNDIEEQRVTFAELVVHAFYRALDARRYEEAYRFYSPARQAATPFDSWKDGYATTQRITVQTSPGTTEGEVEIVLTAIDETTGGATTKLFEGTWTLIADDSVAWGLVLDEATIREIASSPVTID
jgi:hypothetical protein